MAAEITPPLAPDHGTFWHWSLELYPKVKDICLQWQDQYGANVNLLLLLLYLQKHQLVCSDSDIDLLQLSLAQQQQFTLPLRQLRRTLPAGLDAAAASQMKQVLLQAELCSEQLEQQQLITTLQQVVLLPVQARAVSLLFVYLQQLGIKRTPAVLAQIVDLDQHAMQLDFQTP